MKKQHRTAKESYRVRTQLIHGNHESKHWDFDHHLVPPISASAAYRLGSVHRGAQGFVEFASDEADVKGHVPIYIYDRLDEPRISRCFVFAFPNDLRSPPVSSQPLALSLMVNSSSALTRSSRHPMSYSRVLYRISTRRH